MNIAHWLERAASRAADAPALAVGEVIVHSYGEMARRSAALARGLRKTYALRPGDRVVIAARNDPAYIEALFATWWAGLVAVPINAKLHPSEIEWIVNQCGARFTFCSSDLASAVGELRSEQLDVLSLGEPAYQGLAVGEPIAPTPRDATDAAWLFYTSGTTGRPKGAVLTHRNLAAMSLAHLVDVDPTSRGDVLLHPAPLSHGSGLLALPHVNRIGLNVVPESGGFDAAETVSLLGRWRSASLFVAPTMLRWLTEASQDIDPGSARTIVWGGAPMHVSDVLNALDRFGPCLAQIYGQGETPMTISALSRDDIADRDHPRWRDRLASAGTARSIVQVVVANESGQAQPIGELLGEVLVRGDTVMNGYWQDADATAATLRGGWLHTGDLGVLDADGYLTLMDRSKDLIISGGSNIYPREVEEVLAEHPAVQEVSVIGRPDPEWGEIVVAYVAGDASREELNRLCLDRIARYKRPREYIFVASLPKNNYGKVLKTELRIRDAERNGAGAAA